MAKSVIRRTEELVSETEVESECLAGPIVILREPGETGNAVVVIAEAAATLAEEAGHPPESSESPCRNRSPRSKKHQSIVGNGQAAAHRDAVNLAAEAELVLALGPAHRVQPTIVIRERRLQLGGICPKSPGAELQPVHVGIPACISDGGGQIDADVSSGDGCLVIQFIADDVDAETEFIDQGIAEQVSFGDAAKAAMQRNI